MLQEQGSFVEEVVKVMGKSKVLRLVKVCLLGLELVQKYIREGSLHGL